MGKSTAKPKYVSQRTAYMSSAHAPRLQISKPLPKPAQTLKYSFTLSFSSFFKSNRHLSCQSHVVHVSFRLTTLPLTTKSPFLASPKTCELLLTLHLSSLLQEARLTLLFLG